MLLQGGGEGGGRGEEALFEELQHELGGKLLGVVGGAPVPEIRVLAQGRVRPTLGLGVLDLEGLELALRKAGSAVPPRGQLAFEPADHNPAELLLVRGDAAGEALGVEELEERGEALGVAVVGRGRKEELVLEVGRYGPYRLGAGGVGGVAPRA